MKRTILNPVQAAWLADTIARNRRFAGLRMMADDDGGDDKSGGDGDADKGKDTDADKANDKGGDDKLGEGGKKAIEAERAKAREATEAAKAAKGEFDSFKAALLEGLGIKTDDDKGEDALTAVQKQLAAMQLKSDVLELANEHGITDTKDLDLLKSATDPEARKALAERLAPAEDDRDTKSRSRGRMKPDRTQGGGDGSDDKPRGGSVAQVMEERRAARVAKAKTNV